MYKLALVSRKFGIISKETFTNLKNALSSGIRVKRVYKIRTHGDTIS